MEKRGRGRPPLYSSPDEMQERIDAYFASCRGALRKDSNGRLILDKKGRPIFDGAQPITVSGLQYALGFKSRQSLLNYQGRSEFRCVVERARLRVENYAEKRLFDKDGHSGASFVLKTAFGWGQEDIKRGKPDVPTLYTVSKPSVGSNTGF